MSLESIVARTAERVAAGIATGMAGHVPSGGGVRAVLPCLHLGEPLTGLERERAGVDHSRLWTGCLHPALPLGPAVCGCRGCGPRCPGYAAAGLPAGSPSPGPKTNGWQTRPEVVEWHHRAADEFLESVPPYPADRFAGRGVVIAAGGAYWPSACVTVRMLRYVGCNLPVQVWYLGGRGERNERYERLLAPLGVACVDADAHPARAARRILNGFELKLFAVANSPFEDVLFLDADCYPCADPTSLFAEPRFLATGGVYWPDLPKTEAWTHWPFWGVEPRGPKCGLEVGQYLLSKARSWRQLKLAEWYDDHSDWCYGGGQWSDHGDKGPHRVAWAKVGADYTMYSTRAVWQSVAFVHPGPDGRTPMFVHRCRSKLTLSGPGPFTTTPQNAGGNVRAGLPGEDAAFGFLGELRDGQR